MLVKMLDFHPFLLYLFLGKMTKDNYEALAPSIPPVTHGNYFKYFT